jgi:chromosome segregation protein
VVLEEALSLPPLADRAADERELARVEGQLAQIGPVNQVAFQEYEELSRRHDHIAAQVADLQHARSDITKILAAIDRKMRASFLDAFDAVNRNFQQIFATLFPGGEGHLELTDPDDPASTGVEVVAQPRGKRVTKMSLLSGGERSLTALGLLFAAYRTRSVPFYVLDEVEAALDDSNLDRLLAALEVLRKSTQLIVISHQRRTMEAADVLYGVSMRSDGVSHVVSQRLDRTAS